MVKGEEKNLGTTYIHPVLLEEIFLRLPVKSLGKFKTVSKEWKTIIESRMLMKRRMRLRRKILAAHHCDCNIEPCLLPKSKFEGDEEMVYMHCDAQDRLYTCDGLVCIYQPQWINIFNPSTTQILRFPSNLDHRLRHSGSSNEATLSLRHWRDWSDWAVGFGRDKMMGRYKVVMLHFKSSYSEILDAETGVWRKIREPYGGLLKVGYKSVCVDGTIYWLGESLWIIAMDLYKEMYHSVSLPDGWTSTVQTQIANFEDRLVIAQKKQVGAEWILEILTKDAEKITWNKLYSISLAHVLNSPPDRWKLWFKPVALSKQGNLVLFDSLNRLFKYYPKTDEIRCLPSRSCVISPYSDNLDPVPFKSSKRSSFTCRSHPESPDWICYWNSKVWHLLSAEPLLTLICLIAVIFMEMLVRILWSCLL